MWQYTERESKLANHKQSIIDKVDQLFLLLEKLKKILD